MKGGTGCPHSLFPASESFLITTLIPPPQAKLSLSVRALESSAPELQVADGSGGMGQNRWAIGKQEGGSEISVLSCPLGR